jgi:hypothetical protein
VLAEVIGVGVVAALVWLVLADRLLRKWLNMTLPFPHIRLRPPWEVGNPFRVERVGQSSQGRWNHEEGRERQSGYEGRYGGGYEARDEGRRQDESGRGNRAATRSTPTIRYVVAILVLALLVIAFTIGAVLVAKGTTDSTRQIISSALIGIDGGAAATLLAVASHWAGVL